jgi:hypothetical protein
MEKRKSEIIVENVKATNNIILGIFQLEENGFTVNPEFKKEAYRYDKMASEAINKYDGE